MAVLLAAVSTQYTNVMDTEPAAARRQAALMYSIARRQHSV